MRDPLSSAVNAFVDHASQTLAALRPEKRVQVALNQTLAPAMTAVAAEIVRTHGPVAEPAWKQEQHARLPARRRH